MDKVEIGLVQINNMFSGQTYTPYSVGLLQAYVQRHARDPARYRFRSPVYVRMSVQDAVDHLRGVQVAGFSLYVWNVNLSLAIARRLKAEDPSVWIVCGGPHVPDCPDTFLREYPFIDVVVHGEGESVFCALLEQYPDSCAQRGIGSVSYRNADGCCVTEPRRSRMKDLDQVPSPYLDGVFDALMQEHPEHQWLALWETNRGCPFSCVAGDTYIALSDKLIRCDEQEYAMPVYCGDDSHVHIGSLGEKRLLSQGQQPCVTLRFENGLSLTTTPDHLMTGVCGEQLVWRRAKELSPGDWIACEVGQNAIVDEVRLAHPQIDYPPGIGRRRPNDVFFPETLNDDLAWLLGYIIGDGYLSRDGGASLRLCLTSGTENLVREKVRAVFHRDVAVSAASNTKKMRHGWVRSRMVVRFLTESCGVDPARKLRVPRVMFESPCHVIRAFLDGLWSADGYQPHIGPRDLGVSYLTTVSAVLAQEVAHLIHWIGDTAVVRSVPYGERGRAVVYRVEQHGRACRTRRLGTSCVASRIPVSFKVYRGKLGQWSKRAAPPGHMGVTRMALSRLDSAHPLLDESLVYTRVVSVEEGGTQSVYDVSNPPTHRLAANGVRVANCTFCDWGSGAISSKVTQFGMPRLTQELEWFAAHRIEYLYCCDANYGILPRDLEIARMVAGVRTRTGYPHALSVQSTKNATERSYTVQKLLSDAGLSKGVTIAFQSTDERTLEAIKRDNISLDSFRELQRRFVHDRVETYSDLIVGLPGETYESFTTAIDELVAGGQHGRIKFNNLSVLPNAEMADAAYRDRHGLVTVMSPLCNMHGLIIEDDVMEYQELVTASASMPHEDWVRAHVYGWMVSLLHFDKLFQIPLIVVHELTGMPYRALFDALTGPLVQNRGATPVLFDVWSSFEDHARAMQCGGPEYCAVPQRLNLWWPADECQMIELSAQGRMDTLRAEAASVLQSAVCMWQSGPLSDVVLRDAVRLNAALLKMPFHTTNCEVELSTNVWEIYQGALRGERVPLEYSPRISHIDRTSHSWSSWDDWCREVVWYGNQRGAYFYGQDAMARQIVGHYGEALASTAAEIGASAAMATGGMADV